MKNFIKTTLFGGLVVILPSVILVFFFNWLFRAVTDLIQPLTNYISEMSVIPIPEFVADTIVILLIIFICFIVGLVVATQAGRWLHAQFDYVLQQLAPGYRMVKEVVVQIFGGSEGSPFSSGVVARVRLFGKDSPTEVTALITDQDEARDIYTIFMPTGPNPTSGNIYHVPGELVTLCPDVKIDSAMRTVIACGAGSSDLFNPSTADKPSA